MLYHGKGVVGGGGGGDLWAPNYLQTIKERFTRMYEKVH